MTVSVRVHGDRQSGWYWSARIGRLERVVSDRRYANPTNARKASLRFVRAVQAASGVEVVDLRFGKKVVAS